MQVEQLPEHKWLQRLVGVWESEGECATGPDQPPTQMKGTETVRSIGGLWTIGEGHGENPDGTTGVAVMTLGYDPQRKRFVGTFVASMMTHMWVYEGTLDSTGNVLTLDTEGPNMMLSGMARYQDIIEFVDDDHRMLKSQILTEDGSWQHFMSAHYWRKK